METSYHFFLFLFLLFAVNESVLNPAGWQPGRRPSPAQPGKGETLSKARSFPSAHSLTKGLFSGSSFFRKSSSVPQEGWPFNIPWSLWLGSENKITQTHNSGSWLTSIWFSSFPPFLHPKQVASSRQSTGNNPWTLVFQGIIWESWDRPVPCQGGF